MGNDDKKITEWTNKFPFGFEELVKGLSNQKRLAIAGLLLEKKELRFSDIQKELKLKKNVLSLHLKNMLKLGIISRVKSNWKEDEKVFVSFYQLNPIYRRLIESNIKQFNFALIKALLSNKEGIVFPQGNYSEARASYESGLLETPLVRMPIITMEYNKMIGGDVKWETKKQTIIR